MTTTPEQALEILDRANKQPFKVPTVHLNGTSRDALIEQLLHAANAIDEAERALARACPNGRDYYPQGPRALAGAMAEHESRMKRLREVRVELETIAEAILGVPS